MIKIDDMPRRIAVGRTLDNGYSALQIDCGEWVKRHPQFAEYRIEVKRPDGEMYFADTTFADGVLTWNINAADTAIAGDGEFQVVALGTDGERKTSSHPIMFVSDIIAGTASETPPEANKAWTDKVIEETRKSAAQAAASAAEAKKTLESIPEDYTELSEEVGHLTKFNTAVTPVLLNTYSEQMFDGIRHIAYKDSTFSGWLTSWDMRRDMLITELRCEIIAREQAVTKVRVRIALDVCADANVVCDKMLDVNIPPTENQIVTCSLPQITVHQGQTVYVAVDANQICTFVHVYEGTTTYNYGYSTDGNMNKTMDAYAIPDGGKNKLWLVCDGYEFEIGNNIIGTKELKDGAVTCEKTDFIKDYIGKNIFDKNTMAVEGSWYYWESGSSLKQGEGFAVTLQSNEYTSKYAAVEVPVKNPGKITIKQTGGYMHGYWCVDEANICTSVYGTALSASVHDGFTIDVPEGATKVLLSFSNYVTSVNAGYDLMIVYGTEAGDYERYNGYKYLDGIRVEMVHSNVKLKLPTKYALVAGDTFELFYKGIIDAVNPDVYDVVIDCKKGNAYGKRYIWSPTTADVGSHAIKVTLCDTGHNVLDEKTVRLIVKPKAASPTSPINILYVGDSLATAGQVPDEMKRRLTGTGGTPVGDGLNNIAFLGSCENSAKTVRYEGYGGWTFNSYNTEYKSTKYMWIVCNGHEKTESDDQHSVYADANDVNWKIETIEEDRIKLIRTSSTGTLPATGTLTWVSGGVHTENIVYTASEQAAGNPFWDETTTSVNFAKYAQRMGVSYIDYIYVLLGWNSASTTEENYKAQIRTFVNNVLASFPDCKIVLLGLQLPARDGLGVNYGATGIYSRYYDLMQHVWKLNQWYEDIAAEYPDNVTTVNIAGQFDTENNMPSGTRTVNARSTIAEKYQTNGVHPANEGYMQIADACYRDFVHKLQG